MNAHFATAELLPGASTGKFQSANLSDNFTAESRLNMPDLIRNVSQLLKSHF